MKAEQARLTRTERATDQSPPWSMVALLSTPWVLVVVDLLIGGIAYFCAWMVRISIPLLYTADLLPQERWDAVNHYWGLLIASQIFLLYIFGLYDDVRSLRYRELVVHIFSTVAVQAVAVTSVFYFTNGIFPRSVLVVFGLFNFAFLTGWRFYVKSRLHVGTRRVLVVAESLSATDGIIDDIFRNPWMGLQVVGLAVDRSESDPIEGRGGVPVLGSLGETRELVNRYRVDEIVFASQESWKDRVLHSLSQEQTLRQLRIAIQPSVYEIAIGRLRHINIHDTPLIEVRRNPNEPVARLLKRTFDVCFSAVGLVLSLPVWLAVALAILLSSGGPVFYLQERVGLGGRVFRLMKFRTMIRDAEKGTEELLAGAHDPRVTRVGSVLRRFRIDELPQLINVLLGEMSFVGPRPERPGFVRRFSSQLQGYPERHKVKPGMTGLAQVRGYYHTAPENKLRYDLAYIYNYSFSLDLQILLETLKVVLVRRGS